MQKNIANWVANIFLLNGIDKVFVYPGGTIAPLVNACVEANISIECFKNEQGAGYAALAYARLTGKPQVVLVTSGPGVTNVVTPLADAYYDSTPLIVIAGQVSTADLNARKNVRQRGFQEAPTVAITQPVSKHSVCLFSPDEVYCEVPNAFYIATTGRKGPCVIDFPMDMQRFEIANYTASLIKPSGRKETISTSLDTAMLQEIAQACSESKRTIVLLGQGALTAGAYEKYREIVNKLDALVVTTFLGIGSFDNSDSRCLGYIGHTGNLAANCAVFESDLLLVLGSRLDVRQTGTVVDKFVPQGKVAWIDIDSNELENPRVLVQWKIEADLVDFCDEFISVLNNDKIESDKDWQQKLLNTKLQQLEDIPLEGSSYLQPRQVLQQLPGVMKGHQTVVVTGVGCHQHWAARHLLFKPEMHRLLTSGGHGAMGYDLPSSLGAAMAYPDSTILCVVGDGSLLMNIQELASLRERQLNVKILVLNNSRLGLVSQFQLITWGVDPTTGDVLSQDFTAIANGFGIAADKLDKSDEINEKLDWLWAQPGPALLEVIIDPVSDVTPMLLAGQPMNEMWMGRDT